MNHSLSAPAAETCWPVTPVQTPVLHYSLVKYHIHINQVVLRENTVVGRATGGKTKCHLHSWQQHSIVEFYHQAIVHVENISFH